MMCVGEDTNWLRTGTRVCTIGTRVPWYSSTIWYVLEYVLEYHIVVLQRLGERPKKKCNLGAGGPLLPGVQPVRAALASSGLVVGTRSARCAVEWWPPRRCGARM
jgi:hypothetical protein